MTAPSPKPASPLASAFDAYYFAHCCGRPYSRDPEWMDFFGRVADRIVADLAPTRVLDAGCAWGLLVEALRARGVDAWGIDISAYAIGQVAPAVAPYCRVGSIAAPLASTPDERFDLIVCMEVVEHMPPDESERAIANLAAHTDSVLFSSSPLDLREPTHINVRPPEGWAELFAREGLFRDVDFDARFVTPWAWRLRRDTPTLHGLVRRYERWAAAADYAAKEARAEALATQQALAVAETRVERLDWLETRAAELVRDLEDAMAARSDADFERNRTLAQLTDALQTIRAMESSIFWKLRRPWAAASRWLRR